MKFMTLTEVSYYSRKYFPHAVLGIVGVFILYFVLVFIISSLTPVAPSIVTNPIFGKIRPPLLQNASASGKLTYSLDTIEGQPVTATAAANVYFLPDQVPHFGYREQVYLMAKTLGFNTNIANYSLAGRDATFTDSLRVLNVDIGTFNFTYEYKFQQDLLLFFNTVIPAEQEITNQATNFLQSVGRYPSELSQGKTNIVYLKYSPATKKFIVETRPEDANVVEVDFYRPDVDASPQAIPIVSPSYFNSQNYVILVFNKTGFRVLRAQIKFFEKSTDQIGVYPLRTGDRAWAELQAGHALFAQIPPNQEKITIKNMFLGYLDPDTYQQYLEPVYVFLGENNFVAYVPAVDPSFIAD